MSRLSSASRVRSLGRAHASLRSRESFPKSARLLKHADFEHVYQTGERYFSRNLVFFFTRNVPEEEKSDRPNVRIGLTVGRSLGGSVERNRIKRRVREAVRKHLREILSPVDIVINPKKNAAEIEFAELEREIQQGFGAIERGEHQKPNRQREKKANS